MGLRKHYQSHTSYVNANGETIQAKDMFDVPTPVEALLLALNRTKKQGRLLYATINEGEEEMLSLETSIWRTMEEARKQGIITTLKEDGVYSGGQKLPLQPRRYRCSDPTRDKLPENIADYL